MSPNDYNRVYMGCGSLIDADGHSVYAGLIRIGNWQLSFSDMEAKPKTYDVYFSAVKGGRVHFMNDAKYPGSGVFTGFSNE